MARHSTRSAASAAMVVLVLLAAQCTGGESAPEAAGGTQETGPTAEAREAQPADDHAGAAEVADEHVGATEADSEATSHPEASEAADGLGSCVAPASGGEDPTTQPAAGASCGPDDSQADLARAQEELSGLEERLVSARETITELIADIQQQEETVLQLQRRLGVAESSRLLSRPSAPLGMGRQPPDSVGLGARTLRVSREVWPDFMSVRAAVRTEAELRAMQIVCSTPGKGQEFGTCHYLVAGDAEGRVSVFDARGQLSAEGPTAAGSAVTAFHHWQWRRNVTILVTGHANGEVHLNRIHENVPKTGPRTKNSPEPGRKAVSLETSDPPVVSAGAAAAALQHRSLDGSIDPLQGPPAIAFLDSFRCGRSRCLSVADVAGGVGVYYENSTQRIYDGMTMAGERPLAMRTSGTFVTVVFSGGFATMPTRPSTVMENFLQMNPCRGMNESVMTAFQWDATSSSRGYGISEEGDLLVIIVQNSQAKSTPKDGQKSQAQSMCFVRSRTEAAVPPGPVTTAAIKGYLFIASQAGVGIYNTSSYYRLGIVEVLVEPLQNLVGDLGHEPSPAGHLPIMTTDRDRLVAVGYPQGVAAFYMSSLYVIKPYDMSNIQAWAQPVFIVAMVVVGLYQFYRAKGMTSRAPGSGEVNKLLRDLPPHIQSQVNREMAEAQGYGGYSRDGPRASHGRRRDAY